MLTVDLGRLGVNRGDLVLDAGCGEGRHSLKLYESGAVVYSMDIDMESLRKARYSLSLMGKTGKYPGGYFALSGDALRLPYRDETFDLVICSEVMEHVADDSLACSELSRVLKKNGRIAITVPTYFSEAIYDALTCEYFTSPGGHIRKYMPKKLVKIMRSSGLEIYGLGFKHSFHTIWWMIRCVVGLHLNDQPITSAYRKFLHLGLYSGFMRKAEKFFDNFFPKSLVVYAWKKP
ncbi:MAG: class I SAM-dependent methyltransferase [Spirochaetes bacterium]|jgi:ubiquinone/menaquinone biosynthesis C-methylase UbiE|nr:class I SAM-dependent methyltransferase [Spirochaetota bacterium]